MSDTKIQIADPEGEPASSPYRNLWVPLVVVPACIVIVLVLVFALFGALAGEQAGPKRTLERIVQGGSNERRQALYNLVAQLGENHRAAREGREPPYPVEPDFLAEVKAAVDSIEDENPEIRLTLAILLATQGEAEGRGMLQGLLQLDDEQDPEGRTRFYALMNLGLIGDASSLPAVLPYLAHADPGLRTVAAGALGRIGGQAAREALIPVLDDPLLEVRLTAAWTLCDLDPPDPRAAPVLRAALDAEVYERERARDRSRFRQAELVSEIRIRTVRALARLGPLPEDRPLIERLQEDRDLGVVAAAREVLRDGSEGGRE